MGDYFNNLYHFEDKFFYKELNFLIRTHRNFGSQPHLEMNSQKNNSRWVVYTWKVDEGPSSLKEMIRRGLRSFLRNYDNQEKIIMKKSLICLLSILLAVGFYSLAQAMVKGPLCSDCHTMHNSQGGQPMAFQINTALTGFEPDESPNPGLLITSCLGCHSSIGSAVIEDGVPIVFNMMSAPANYLAGGNFYWVKGDDTKGHNVLGISATDQNLSEAPGNPYSCANSCHMSLAVVQTAVSDLGSGCEGCHLNVKHHALDGTGTKLVDSAAKGWYRFLSGHMSGDGHGVAGIEDEDWQDTKSAADHNEYLGWSGDKEYAAGFYNLGHTMTAFCCGCHGNFHVQQDSGSWLRHPSDAVIPNSGEYANAFGAAGSGAGIYDPLIPLARPSLSGWTAPSASVTLGTGGDLVMCLSCHRPHGSPYYKMMRWDYKSTTLSEALSGCSVCHTTKN
jgi:hypothetical protein